MKHIIILMMTIFILSSQTIAQGNIDFYENPQYIKQHHIKEMNYKILGYVNKDSKDSNDISTQSTLSFNSDGNIVSIISWNTYSKKNGLSNIVNYIYDINKNKVREEKTLYSTQEIDNFKYNSKNELIFILTEYPNAYTTDTSYGFSFYEYHKSSDKETTITAYTDRGNYFMTLKYDKDNNIISEIVKHKDGATTNVSYKYLDNRIVSSKYSGNGAINLALGIIENEFVYNKSGLVEKIIVYENGKPQRVQLFNYVID